MVPVEWVDAGEWEAIEAAFNAVEDIRSSSSQSEIDFSDCREECKPVAKRARRQLPPNWFDPPVSKYVARAKLPKMVFRGKIVYCRTYEEVENAACELMGTISCLREDGKQTNVSLGFDIEWKPAFQRGVAQGRAAVLQLCLDSSRCYIFHIFYSGMPQVLQNILEAETICKVGVGIHGDVDKLKLDYSVKVAKVVDLSAMANQKMATFAKNWSLSSLAEKLTCKVIDKPMDIRCGDWEVQPLSPQQLTYAATDAFASLHLYQVDTNYNIYLHIVLSTHYTHALILY